MVRGKNATSKGGHTSTPYNTRSKQVYQGLLDRWVNSQQKEVAARKINSEADKNQVNKKLVMDERAGGDDETAKGAAKHGGDEKQRENHSTVVSTEERDTNVNEKKNDNSDLSDDESESGDERTIINAEELGNDENLNAETESVDEVEKEKSDGNSVKNDGYKEDKINNKNKNNNKETQREAEGNEGPIPWVELVEMMSDMVRERLDEREEEKERERYLKIENTMWQLAKKIEKKVENRLEQMSGNTREKQVCEKCGTRRDEENAMRLERDRLIRRWEEERSRLIKRCERAEERVRSMEKKQRDEQARGTNDGLSYKAWEYEMPGVVEEMSRVGWEWKEMEKQRLASNQRNTCESWLRGDTIHRMQLEKANVENAAREKEKGWSNRDKEYKEVEKRAEQPRAVPRKLNDAEYEIERAKREERKLNLFIRHSLASNLEAVKIIQTKTGLNIDKMEKRYIGERTIKVKFGKMSEKISFLKNRWELREKYIFLDNDETEREIEIIKWMRQLENEERRKGTNTKRGYMKICINGVWWYWDEKEGLSRVKPPAL
ncbi:golgin subfamily A member 6-like protein 24 [Microplitis mediator]|uniref:golgin subfamily A member 6-like protein 24 n=1 Tax=Microplitis mediator TaxID=375433 RepID=UPI0025566D13|nr:golgin subfamily A member 6-like protein 24 [Microplitis mediator]